MKNFRLAAAAVALLALTAVPVFAGGTGSTWFDLENCGMCKGILEEPGLMDHMHWDTHKVTTGMMCVVTVDPGSEEAWGRAMMKMEAAGKKLAAGEKMPLCQMCQSYGALMMAGAKTDEIDTKVGHVSMLTATDPKVVEKIHTHAQKTIDEYAKMMAAEKSKS